MEEVKHSIKVFVFHFAKSEIEYLLLKVKPRLESFWGPVSGVVEPWEDIERAILRSVREETGLDRPAELLDLDMRNIWSVGDFKCVDWIYGFHARGESRQLRPGEEVSEFRWCEFPVTYEFLESQEHRNAVLRLHTMLDCR